jgi:hypothetical protein
MANQNQNIPTGTGEVLKSFQLTTDSIAKKSDKEYGKSIASFIASTVMAGTTGYYFIRNGRFKKNRNAANGRIDVFARFSDRMEFNSKPNYANLNWQSIHMHNRVISGLVGRWMRRNEKISVTATDSLSVKEKQEEYDRLEFFINNRDKLLALQKASGVQILPQEEMPETQDELDLWQSQFQRLPEEILYELGTNDVLAANGFFDSNKEKGLHDSAEVGFVGTYTWMDKEGVIHVELVQPENAFYSDSKYPDFRDTAWRGRVKSWKMSELRKEYGKEFGGDLTEEQLWDIAETSRQYNLTDKITWNAMWNTAFMRPYDDWNVDAFEFELKTVDSETYTVTETRQNKSTIIQKGRPNKLKDNQRSIEDTNINIYRGVYLKDQNILLEWGLKKNMIRPQDPKEAGNAEFSYSFYMYQAYEMRNLAVPEKIEVPVDGMIMVDLKIQQLVAKMRPTGAAIDETALQNIDYGLGDKNKDIDYKRLYDQTGDIYYRGLDAEGNRVPVPITELQNSGFLGQMQGLIELYQFHFQRLKDELGEDPNLITQALQPRVTAGNVNTAERTAENATDYMYRAWGAVMEETAKKISCLLKKSVTHGANVYRDLLKESDVQGRIFGTKFKMLPTEQEIAILDARMNQAVAANPDIVMYLDTFKILRIAKEDVKLAEKYYTIAMKKMLQSKLSQARENQQMTFEGQAKAAQIAEEEKRKTENNKGKIDLEQKRIEGEWSAKNAVISMVTGLLGKGVPIDASLKPLVNATVENLMLPLLVQNEEQKAAIMESMMQMEEPPEEQPVVQPDQQQIPQPPIQQVA